ncbi:hypothetical protein PF001_g4950 [Phytophthora fragariae]|uniref:Myb/SANT-like DNA-binding domain-containing protein n=1 Tax=Phytophthora fragariae TaxID=53985 RepID=A0A6A4EFY8_9STRA|nr:hypothetical protein PF001_g4950 [Phytophthora fragariae]
MEAGHACHFLARSAMATQLPRRRVIDILEEEVVRCNAELARVDPNGGDVGICNSRIVTLAGIARACNISKEEIERIYLPEDTGQDQPPRRQAAYVRAPDDRKLLFREIIGERMTLDGPVLRLDWEQSEVPVRNVPAEYNGMDVMSIEFAVEGKGRKPKAEEIAESRDVASAAIDAFTSALKYNDADLREERSSLNDELEGLKAQLEAKSEECNVLEKEAALHSCKLMQTLHEDAVPSDPAMPARTAPDTVPTAAASPSSDAAVSAVATAPTGTTTKRAARAPREPGSAKKAKSMQRLKWTNAMVAEMLRLRFDDGDVKRRLETADTKTKKALAWQQFASALWQSQGVVISQVQLYQKYRQVKCIYRKGRRERQQTGNNTSEPFAVDEGLWAVLHDAFASRVGLSGEVLVGTHLEEDASDENAAADATETSGTSPAKGKLQPVVELAVALQTGMEAIAASMSASAAGRDQLQQLASTIEQQARAMAAQREENRHFQQMQLQLLRDLLANKSQ